jgi:cyclic pyranopterin phosphate synthase
LLTHLDEQQRPTMVDVTHKLITPRMARAQCQIQLPECLRPYLKQQELNLKKGPVFQTAIIAGTMAVKKTSELIPFCHPLPIESCKILVSCDEQLLVTVICQVKTTHKTGVEMEAMTGATVAALTIYDMCKAVSLEIVLKEARLLAKTGGKRTILERPLYGLVLTGGKSSRMGEPKALLNYHGKAHGAWTAELIGAFCEKVFLSAKPGQWDNT